MNAIPRIASVAALIAEPARAKMLNALFGGETLTATDLALAAGVTIQTASSHLAMMREAGLLTADRRGRSHYYRLAGSAVADAMEALAVLAADSAHPRWRVSLRVEPIRLARTCYDHLAGMLGVAVTEAMVKRRHLTPKNGDFILPPAGERFFAALEIDVGQMRGLRRRFASQCLDWSERRPHLAGALGAALAERCFGLGWIRRAPASRAVIVTTKGQEAFEDLFAIAPAAWPRAARQ